MTDPIPDFETRVQAALAAEADAVRPGDGSLDAIRTRARAARRRRRAAVAGAGMVALVAIAVAVPLLDGASHPDVSTGSDDNTPAPTEAPDPTAEAPDPTTSTTPTTTATTATTAPSEPAYEFGSQPLWPFRTRAEADQWLTEGAPGGHQPWHDSADETALLFTQSYLGFAEIDQVTTREVGATEAWIGVGYVPEPGADAATAAVVHLLRFGPDADAPWEVVGTRDTTLALKTPGGYGSPLSSPLTVGGTVTGVDESLHVQVRQQSSPQLLGESCCLPAGGEVMPWEATVEVTGEVVDAAVTVVVFTGGHVQDVERFAITGLRG